MLPTITNDRVTLRPWRRSDAGDLQRAMQDSETVRWMAIDLPYTIEDARGFIDGTSSAWEQRQAAHFVIAGPDDRLIGYLGVLSVEDRMSVVELGYWVAPPARRQGVASRAVELAVEWARYDLNARRIELGMMSGNEASRRVAESVGFVFEGTKPSDNLVDGEPVGEWIFVLPMSNEEDRQPNRDT
jgi:RimJ/RimL family protein N-acetyltransferase